MLFPQNIGSHLSIDETSLSRGEVYTILTNKAAKGGKGSIVAIVAGTKAAYGLTRLAKWHEKVRQSGFKSFNTVARSIENHYKTIVNYFDNRSLNASAESFNAKIKAFRS